MKQWYVLLGDRIGGRGSVCFETSTGRARQTEVLGDGHSTSGSGEDVFELEGGNAEGFGGPAIGTAVRKSSANFTLQIDRDINAHG
jgi:hypothetical protein